MRDTDTNCVVDCICECPKIDCVSICGGPGFIERRNTQTKCIISCECQVICPDKDCKKECGSLDFEAVTDTNQCIMHCLCDTSPLLPTPSSPATTTTTTPQNVICQDVNCTRMCRGLEFVEERETTGCVSGCVCCQLNDCETRCDGLEYHEVKNPVTGCVDDCRCVCPVVNCTAVCIGVELC